MVVIIPPNARGVEASRPRADLFAIADVMAEQFLEAPGVQRLLVGLEGKRPSAKPCKGGLG
jgi:hypothetical protein